MRRRWRIAIAVGVAVATAFPALLIYGRERAWGHAGPADLGPVDFAALERSATPNDAIAASPGALPDALAPDLVLPIYTAASDAVMDAIDVRLARLDAELDLVASGTGMRRYVTRSTLMRFPDTTVIETVPLPAGTGLRAYARATVGRADFGANRARLERWLADLPLPTVSSE